MKIFIQQDAIWGDTFGVRMGVPVSGSEWAIAEPIQFRVLKDEDRQRETLPCFTFKKGDAQAFMDELWRAGFRPTEGSGSAGSLAATQAHLNDLRAIVGAKLGVDLK